MRNNTGGTGRKRLSTNSFCVRTLKRIFTCNGLKDSGCACPKCFDRGAFPSCLSSVGRRGRPKH